MRDDYIDDDFLSEEPEYYEEGYDESTYDEEFYEGEPVYEDEYDNYSDDEITDKDEYYEQEKKRKTSGKKSRKKTKKNPRARDLKVLMCFFILLMVAVIINECRFIYAESETAINNSYNPRQELLAQRNIRGQILSRDKEILAITAKGEDGAETRVYPYSNLFAHAVGFSTKGKTGVEYLGNMALLNSNASMGEKIQNELSAEKNIGDNVITTLDVDLQTICYQSLGAFNGAVIVSDPKTGDILAMVSKPDFDPNHIAEEWDSFTEDSESSVLLNRTTMGLYPPGSTFKIITALEYYRENGGNTSSYSYTCNGSYVNDGDKINCFHGSKHGTIDLKRSFEKSCNSSFANIGMGLDKSKLYKTCDSLMFNKTLGVTLPTAKTRYELNEASSSYDVMQTSIGQGKTLVTPIQINMITAAIANGGTCYKPQMIDRIENYEGQVVKEYEPEKYDTLMTAEEAAFLKDLMIGVVQSGTGTKLKNDNYTAAGKTGSAEFSSNKEDSHAWFTGFAPAEDPKICVTIIVEGAGSGGEYAVPIARRIMDAYFLQ